jgi:demethylmenaquinone methyltransferase / 2-methoxy-6-polyprenyl-1,4-benzoquinol methylase
MTLNFPNPTEKRDYVRHMFGRIADRYDLLNKIISLGQDSFWRKQVVNILRPESNQMYLDIGSGTGDLAREIINIRPDAMVVAADLTFQMIKVGKKRDNLPQINWIAADAQALPFPAETFNGAVSGYLLRNVADQKTALEEQFRVIHFGAKVISLDTTPPVRNWYYPFILGYLQLVIPLIGKLLTSDPQAYSYLPRSTGKHTPAHDLAGIFQEGGLVSVGYTKLMLGTMAIHFGEKPAPFDENRIK